MPGARPARHAPGKAASRSPTGEGSKPISPGDGGWVPVAPSPMSFHPGAVDPHPLSTVEIAGIAGQFAASARMAREAGFKVLELHSAHGYLSHSFLSPIVAPG